MVPGRRHTFPFVLKNLLVKSNMTGKDLADILGVSPGAVYNWLSGRTEPDIDTLIKIADHFRINLDQLVGRKYKTCNNAKNAQEVQDINEVIQNLSALSGVSPEAISAAIAAAQMQVMVSVDNNDWITQSEAADLMGVSRQMIHSLVKRGYIYARPEDRKVRRSQVISYYQGIRRKHASIVLGSEESKTENQLLTIVVPDVPPPFDPRFVPMAAHAPGHEGEHPWNLMTAEDRERIREIMEQQYREWWKTASPEEKRRAWEDWLRFVAQHGLRGLDTPPVDPK